MVRKSCNIWKWKIRQKMIMKKNYAREIEKNRTWFLIKICQNENMKFYLIENIGLYNDRELGIMIMIQKTEWSYLSNLAIFECTDNQYHLMFFFVQKIEKKDFIHLNLWSSHGWKKSILIVYRWNNLSLLSTREIFWDELLSIIVICHIHKSRSE